jgi:hypothetical protein
VPQRISGEALVFVAGVFHPGPALRVSQGAELVSGNTEERSTEDTPTGSHSRGKINGESLGAAQQVRLKLIVPVMAKENVGCVEFLGQLREPA